LSTNRPGIEVKGALPPGPRLRQATKREEGRGKRKGESIHSPETCLPGSGSVISAVKKNTDLLRQGYTQINADKGKSKPVACIKIDHECSPYPWHGRVGSAR
jgi:hypothetical protein